MQPQPEIISYNNSSNSNNHNHYQNNVINKNNSSTSNNKIKITTTNSTNIQDQQRQTEAISTATIVQEQQQQQQQNKITSTTKLRPRVIKSKQPLLNFRFYLDILDHQLTKRIEKQIKVLGGTQEFFLDANVVTHFITDKSELPVNVLNVVPNSLTEQPKTPVTPQQNLFNENAIKQNTTRVAQTRADAILSRVRLQSGVANSSPIRVTTPTTTTYNSNNKSNCNLEQEKDLLATTATITPYIVWQTDYALRFFKKVQHELKSYLQPENQREVGTKTHQQREKLLKTGIRSRTQPATAATIAAAAANCGINGNIDTIQFKGGFIKIESIKRSCRPYYQLFRRPHCEWPKISLTSDEGAFCLFANNKTPTTTTTTTTTTQIANNTGAMTRKSRSRSSQCVTPLPLPVATVQNLRKQANVAATPTPSTTTTPTTGRNNSQCRQIKDSTDKQCGVCEICKIEYDTLTIHLKTKDHEYFAKNSQNFLALDTLIKSSADVNKFLADEVESNNAIVKSVTNDLEEMVVEDDGLRHEIVLDPLEQSLDMAIANHSPPLREKSKRSTKGKHSSEKFQQTRSKASLTKATLTTTPPTTTPTITTLDLTPTKHNNISSTRRKTNAVKNLSSPVRPFPPPSSLYKVVETSQLEQTPKRGAAGRVTDNVNGSPSIIVKFKKVRQAELLRLNGEAENFMFPNKQQSQQQQQRRASSDLPTDIDRHSSSDRLRTSIYSSSSLDSSTVSDIVAIPTEATITTTLTYDETPQKRTSMSNRNSDGTFAKKKQSFQKAPIQPETVQQLNTAGTTTTKTIIRKSTTRTTNRKTKQTVSLVADLSPPSAAAAIVAATAKITLPAATRKSSRTATAIVSAATTSSRLLMAAAEVVKKSGKTKRTNTSQNITTTTTAETVGITVKSEIIDTNEIETATTTTSTTTTATNIKPAKINRCNNRMRSCRLVEPAEIKVVKMEDRMGDSSATNSENDDNNKNQSNMDIDEIKIEQFAEVKQEEQIIDVKVSRRRRRRLSRVGQNEELYCSSEKATTTTPVKSNRNISVNKIIANVIDDDDDDDDEDDDEDDAEDNDDVIADKDFKLKLSKAIRRPTGKRNRGKRKRKVRKLPKKRKIIVTKAAAAKTTTTTTVAAAAAAATTKENVKLENIVANEKSNKESKNDMQRKIKLAQFYDYQKSDRIQQQTYAFERVPQTDLWYRVFMRQDACEEQYFEYFGSTQYHKLPYELGPIPYTHTNVGESSCKLCLSGKMRKDNEEGKNIKNIKEDLHETESKMNKTMGNEARVETTTMDSNSSVKTTTIPPYTLKHKKLHLLQRYRQEQEALQQQEEQKEKDIEQEQQQEEKQQQLQLEELIAMETETLTNGIQSDMERCERAGSTQSTTSSCASSNNTNSHNHSNNSHRKRSAFRNKLLNKAAMLSLELPPRKSPREHASTLALVSIIKQRQGSKSNSDADEMASAPTTPIPTAVPILTPIPISMPLAINSVAVKEEISNNKTISRSTAATPIEEMCFATEISENVKRMRRGRNKYDHSPPYVLTTSRRLARKKLLKNQESEKHEKVIEIKVEEKQAEQPKKEVVQVEVQEPKPELARIPKSPIHRLKNIFQPSKTITRKTSSLARTKTPLLINNNCNTMLHSKGISLPPSVRKTGQKKGVLEFSVEEAALSALNAALEPKVSPQQLASQIDQFLTDNCKDFDLDELSAFESNNKELDKVETPPATDYFSCDFDLCDLLQDSQNPLLGDEEVQERSQEKKHLNLYNKMAINKYFHKRKYMKSNRTGWPKVPRKKYSMRHQTIIQSQSVKIVPEVKLVTPPDSEENKMESECIIDKLEDDLDKEPEPEVDQADTIVEKLENLKGEDTDVDTFYDGAETLPEEDDADTLPDSIVEEEMEEDELVRAQTPVACKAMDDEDEKAVEADDEDEFNDALETEEIEECALTNEEEGMVENTVSDHEIVEQEEVPMVVEEEEEEEHELDLPKSRRNSNLGKALANCLSSLNDSTNIEEQCVEEDTNSMTATTSTPTTHMTRNMRRTPQLNGSLVSCNSPSERAGDNSDIFTVSSDGLDTDLDLSNPHAHSKHDEQQQQSVTTCNNRNKSNKYDISKYVKNPAANTCAAEAATAAAKSLAIAQFLKKEVRVTCRRIRAPFRRFRYRR